MARQLYEEAIADAKQVMSVAEDNAKRAIIEVVAPRIREALERSLLESPELGSDADQDVLVDVPDPFQDLTGGEDDQAAAAISPPGLDGDVVLDLDGLKPSSDSASPGCPAGSPGAPGQPGEDFVLNAESLAALEPVIAGSGRLSAADVELRTYRLGEAIANIVRAERTQRRKPAFRREIVEMISRVKNTYEHVQESIKDPSKKRVLEGKLEAFNRALGRFTDMSKQRRGTRVNEGDITLKLTGVPDELDLDNVGVDLIKDDEDEGGDDSGGGDDLDLDMGDDDDDGSKKMGEGRRLSDNTVVEIDEGMLRREISRVRSLREEAVPSTKGRAPRGAQLDDFGGGSDEGDPWLDSDVPEGGTSIKVVGEADGDDDEMLEIDMGEGEPPMAECDDDMPMEARRRRLATLREAVRRARRSGDARRLAEATAAYRRAAGRTAPRRTSRGLAESARSARAGTRSNSGPRRSPAGGGAVERNLRAQLVQTNLRNARLTATAKLLQNESLTPQQRADVVEKLESARSPREVKLVYETLVSSLSKRSRSLSESAGRRVLGSSSRSTRPASTTLNESSEAARWAQLAGINR